jgi:hypothetical protein
MAYGNTVMPFTMKETPDRGLCGTCRSAHIRDGDRFADTQIFCNEMPGERVRFLVRSCSEYARKNEQDRYEMEQIAWVLEVKKGRVIGFRPPKGQRDDDKD